MTPVITRPAWFAEYLIAIIVYRERVADTAACKMITVGNFMLQGAEQVLRWRVRPLISRAFGDGRELLADELQLAGKLIERDVRQCSSAARSYAVSIALLLVAIFALIGGLSALLVRIFPALSIDEVLLGLAAVCFIGGYLAEKSARSELTKSFRAPKEMAEELTGI